MTRRLTILFAFAGFIVAGCASLHAQASPLEDSLYCASIHRMMHFRVCLPASESAGRTYPTILMLHGLGGNYRNWTDLTNIRNLALLDTVLVVTPDAGDSWYVDSFTDTSAKYESAIVGDLLRYVLSKYPADKRYLGIGGLSMGGYGALTIGLRHPEIFRFIGEMSGALFVPFGIPDLNKFGRENLRPMLTSVFGTDSLAWRAVAPERIAATIDTNRVPYIYMVSGIQDDLSIRVAIHRSFADILRARGIRYEYHETPGRHSWDFWAREIGPLLQRFRELCNAR
jgi:putative tributyrin esterase